ncbi:MAG: ribbon-helix-helix domain-containing protein [Thermoplasmata archaeon]
MKEINERVTLRLEKDNLERMDSYLQKSREFANRSQFLRVAVKNFIDRAEKAQEEVSLKIPARFLEYIDAQVADGYFPSREHAILKCIEGFLTLEKVEEIEKHKKRMGIASGKMVSVDYGGKDELIDR